MICGLQNNTLANTLKGHSLVGRLNVEEEKHIHDMTKYHIASRHILLTLQDQKEENKTNIAHIYKQ